MKNNLWVLSSIQDRALLAGSKVKYTLFDQRISQLSVGSS